MIVVAIVGILAALAIYGVRKYIANAKTAEARNSIGQIAKDATTAYAREGMQATVLDPGASTAVVNRLCASASNTVPANGIADVKGKKYQSKASEWNSGDKDTGWACLKFHMTEPQYYAYSYGATGSNAEGSTFTAGAAGDLDGDGVGSSFSLTGKLQKSGSGADSQLEVNVAPNILEDKPEE